MTYTYRIVTLNINGLESNNRNLMPEEFIRRHNTDFAVFQEVTNVHGITMKVYQVIDNVGILGRARQYSIRKTYRCTRHSVYHLVEE